MGHDENMDSVPSSKASDLREHLGDIGRFGVRLRMLDFVPGIDHQSVKAPFLLRPERKSQDPVHIGIDGVKEDKMRIQPCNPLVPFMSVHPGRHPFMKGLSDVKGQEPRDEVVQGLILGRIHANPPIVVFAHID